MQGVKATEALVGFFKTLIPFSVASFIFVLWSPYVYFRIVALIQSNMVNLAQASVQYNMRH